MEVFIIFAKTLDGFIARTKNQSSFTWTSREDKLWYREQTKMAGAVIFGRTTYETFNKPIPHCLNLIYTRSQADELAKITMANLMKLKGKTTVMTTKLPPGEIKDKLNTAGFTGLSVSGGSEVYTTFIKAKIVDKLFITIEPIVFGQGINPFSESLELERFTLNKIHKLNQDSLCLEYQSKL